MSSVQQQVLYERLKFIMNNSCNTVSESKIETITLKRESVKIQCSEYSPKPQSVIECCLHCGSVRIKKHGTTRGGVRRYICKDCGKTFTENYGLITHYSHLSEWQWIEIIRGTVSKLSITDISKNIKASTSTVWSCRLKIYQTLKNIYGYNDKFNGVVEIDGKYERMSFKGCKDKKFFIEKLGRLPRHHRSRNERMEYLDSCGMYAELFKKKPGLLKEMIYGSQKRLSGRNTIDVKHQSVCIMTTIDHHNNIYIEPITAGTPNAYDVYGCLESRITQENIMVTDEHTSYKYFSRKEKLNHIRILGGTYINNGYSLARINSLHSEIDKFISKDLENKPATKYLDLYLMMFWWLQKNKDLNGRDLSQKLFDTMTGKVSMSERANMKRITIKSLVSRELPIDTKGFYPKCV